MKKKRRQDSWEEEIKAMLGKEREEMKLPDSVKPERIREKILDYELEQEKAGQGKEETEQRTQNTEYKTQNTENRKKYSEKRTYAVRRAGAVLVAMAAVLVLAVGGRTLALSRQGGKLIEWKQNTTAGDSSQKTGESGGASGENLEAEGDKKTDAAADGTSSGAAAEDAECSAEKREDVLVGIQKAENYEELLKLYKEAGIIGRQEETKPSLWDQIKTTLGWKKESYDYDGADNILNSADMAGMSDGGVIFNEKAEPEGFDNGSASADTVPAESIDSAESMGAAGSMDAAESMDESEADFSGTNVQVAGVDEGDILKTDGTYIYRLSSESGAIYIYRADGKDVTQAGSIALPPYQGEKSGGRSWSDMLLGDGRLAVVATVTEYDNREDPTAWEDGEVWIQNEKSADIAVDSVDCYPGYRFGNRTSRTELFVYDVSNPASPERIETRVQEGEYQAVRMVDGIVYLVSYKQNNSWYFCDTAEETEYFKNCYVPQVDGAMLPCDRIYLPETPQTPNSVIITSTDLKNPGQHLDSVAILGDATQLYMSNENLYLWQTEYRWWTPYESNDETTTTIMKYSYQDGSMAAAGSATIKGYLNNSFSMDEYKGKLRVVTTCDVEKAREGSQENEMSTENQLYVLDEAMQVVGSIENLAEGEYVKSARFFGDIGYFVTFRQTDPLFSVDLSEPDHPKVIGKLKIPGFSEYLHPYGKGLLLGIGQEADETSGGTEGVKLSMFDISNPANVREVAKCVVRDADYSSSDAEYNHKAILVSADKNVIGFSIESGKSTDYEWKNSYEYCLFSYTEEEGFTERITHDFGEWENQYGSRGIYIGDYLYILYGYDRQQIAVYRLSDGTSYGVKDFS